MIGRAKDMLGYAGKYDELRSAFLLLPYVVSFHILWHFEVRTT